jgi:hypothetical protein
MTSVKAKCSECGNSLSLRVVQQEGCENALNPSANLLLPNGVGVRKHSVLFSSYDAWNEDSILQSFREMSPSIGNILEAAWTGQVQELEELLGQDETLDSLKEGLIRDSTGRTPLHLAAACGNVESVQLLLQKGIFCLTAVCLTCKKT